MLELPRRRFLTGLVGIIAAPAVVRAGSLMRVAAVPRGPITATEVVAAEQAFAEQAAAIPDYWVQLTVPRFVAEPPPVDPSLLAMADAYARGQSGLGVVRLSERWDKNTVVLGYRLTSREC